MNKKLAFAATLAKATTFTFVAVVLGQAAVANAVTLPASAKAAFTTVKKVADEVK
jgi:hypothetical protein